ncbi:Log1p ASCRUDRAFT_75927 [Ascoidea rubescens DSM 1968]|uniref:Cytokinin riboside 5'-monophosphate phosphoribohydrolase n=1 Tax=Ascoidea rubescens DSM 1968 TaxID=1344418 RepID=A0A1D2VHZ1_9ASCO|nr:hypothetical protein ASCRUDRAFT_75927 [Ascoidea rubescens DSM 1968]ODV61225.1 hypothetical protein ASCRUDRAFT_75927 [Ascoidea rubescens DSM 1968]
MTADQSDDPKILSTTNHQFPNKPEKTLCVFCGSRDGSSPLFMEETENLAIKLASLNYGVIYGGGDLGLMGQVARTVINHKGYVHGVIPHPLFERERHSSTLSGQYGKTTVVQDMHTRKRLMGKEADGFIALPGGYGTLEELMEIVTWSQLGIHSKPIIVFNIDGFYDGLKVFLKSCVGTGFVGLGQSQILVFANTVDEVIEKFQNYKAPDGRLDLNWDIQ